jgi:hypothetical protein
MKSGGACCHTYFGLIDRLRPHCTDDRCPSGADRISLGRKIDLTFENDEDREYHRSGMYEFCGILLLLADDLW